jgi:hypothetical protein
VPGADATFLSGINASGQKGGTYRKDGRNWGFSLSNKGVLTTYNPPNAIRADNAYPDAQGQVSGTFRTHVTPACGDCPDFTRHGWTWYKGVYTQIDDPAALASPTNPTAAGAGTTVFGQSENGVILGAYQDPDGSQHFGFLLRKGVFTHLTPPSNYYDTAPVDLNDAGQLVGWYTTSPTSTQHGFSLIKGVYTTIDVPGADLTDVNSVNAKGQIVGLWEKGDAGHGFLAQLPH